jgi:uncharacterized protein YgiM (DUF1202 family)
MKKFLFALIALSTSVYAQDAVKVKVKGDRVSLRAAPEATAVLLDRALIGDELVLKDNSHPDWIGVLPPDKIDFWVSREFVSTNTVIPKTLNIRSGPSLSHSVVGSANQGDVLTIRGEMTDWLKIAPTSNTVIWISRKFVEAPRPEVAEPVVIVEPVEAVVSAQEPDPVVQVVEEPTVQEIMTAVSTTAQKKLMADPAKPQGVESTYTGVLQPADAMLHILVDEHFRDIVVCYVRGNAAQMQTFKGMKLAITGKAYWAEGKDLPVVVPARIKPFATEKTK